MNAIRKSFIFILFIWIVFVLERVLQINLVQFGIIPRLKVGLPGILFSPFLHGNKAHIISNTLTLFVLLFTLFSFYKRIAVQVIFFSIIIGGTLVWIFGRPNIHIGASGLIYGIAGYLIFAGLFNRSFKSFLIALIIGFLYGGLIYGVLPGEEYISWEAHFFGAFSGLFLALVYRNSYK